jgi:hypothetical protein
MNILEQEDLVKGLPDQALFQQAENPSGQLPPFLVISEIQRRTDMRKRFESSEAQPQGTVADQIVMEGLGATMPQQAPMSPPPGSMLPQGSMPPPAGFAPSPSPSLSQMEGTLPLMGQGMAAGGILGMSNGGVVRMQSGNRTERQQALVRRRNAGQRADDRNEEKFKKRFGNRFEGQGGHALRSNPDYSEYQRNLQSFLDENREAEIEAEQNPEVIAQTYEEALPVGFVDDTQLAPYVSPVGGEESYDAWMARDGFADEVPSDTGTEYLVDSNNLPYGDADPDATEGANLSTIESILDRQLASDVGTTITEGEGLETEVTEGKDSLTALIDQFAKLRTGAEGRLDSRRSESQDLIDQIRDEGRRDAFSSALMQLGAGIAGGDMAGGWQRAGEVATSTNAVARDAARAEQRGMRDYEEAALSGMDELGMKEAQFVYGEEKETGAREEALRKWEAEHGLTKLAQDNDLFFKQANLEMEGEKLKENIYIGREGLKNEVTKINNKLAENTELTKREAMRTFTNVLDSIQDYMDELPITTTAEEREVIRDTQQRRILTALRIELGEDFYQAFIADYEPTRGGAGGLEGEDLVNSILSDE